MLAGIAVATVLFAVYIVILVRSVPPAPGVLEAPPEESHRREAG